MKGSGKAVGVAETAVCMNGFRKFRRHGGASYKDADIGTEIAEDADIFFR